MIHTRTLFLLLLIFTVSGCNWLTGAIPEPNVVKVQQLLADRQSQTTMEQPTPSDKATSSEAIRSYPEWDLEQAAADALGRIGAPAVSELTRALRDIDPDRRQRAARILARIGPPAVAAVPELTKALQDADPLVRKLAARALGQVGPDAAVGVPALIELLNEE